MEDKNNARNDARESKTCAKCSTKVSSNDAVFGESKMEEVAAKLTLVRRRVISPCWLPGGGGGGGDVAASATPRE